MRRIPFGLLACLCAALAACDSVDTQHMIGEPTQDDLSTDLSGVWRPAGDGEEKDRMQVSWEGQGVVMVKASDPKPGDEDKTLRVVLTQPGEHLIAHVREAGEGGPWGFAAVRVKRGVMVVWPARVGVFEEAVEKGDLKGNVKRGDHTTAVHITASQQDVTRFVASRELWDLFQVEQPVVMVREAAGGGQ